jgi:excinuclease ABC subunit A
VHGIAIIDGMETGSLYVEGAAENNLLDVDVELGGGLTAIVGVSGSGKSSLAFDVVYHEARRRLLDALSLASPWSRLPPARVRQIRGLAPAVALSQDSVIRNPASTVATAAGIHPFLRLLYARFAARVCPECETAVEVLTEEERLARARTLLDDDGGEVVVPLVTRAPGTHARLLDLLGRRFGRPALEVDGSAWRGRALAAATPHDIRVRTATLERGAGAAAVRSALASADALGAAVVELRTNGKAHPLALAPLCPACGRRVPALRPADFRPGRVETDAYRLAGLTLAELLARPVAEARRLLAELELVPSAARAVGDARRRLDALDGVGLDYLTLDRSSPTLSRGEAQRLRLAVLLTNRVENVVHVLDEPTIGLDPEQVRRVLEQLARLRGPVLMVEHDRAAVAAADDVLELGPGAGRDGGRVVFQGTPARLWRADTPSALAFPHRPARPRRAVADSAQTIGLRAAQLRNLRGFDCNFPVGRLSVVTGPSGAGKTTLVRDVLVASLQAGEPIGCAAVAGVRLRPVVVDQSPIGRNPRSTPATYSGLATRIRDLFARASALPPSSFSFNRPEGACPACEGMGAVELSHRFLQPTWLTCEVCGGRRFGVESLAVRLKLDGRSLDIADVFALSVGEARELLRDDRGSARILAALSALGLDYLTLGQPSPRLSGGEAQRVKLARQLASTGVGDLLVVDEPTTGLHPADLARLLGVLRGTADGGTTVIVVEHHPEVVAAADWIIRLGPEGGPRGGELLEAGPPRARRLPPVRPRAAPRKKPRSAPSIAIRRAAEHNLQSVSLDIKKGAITAFVGVSGSGKSSLLVDVIQAEASRRLLECLSLYERQSVKEGPEAAVGSLEGLGPTVFVTPERPRGRRATVGTASELSFHLAVLLAQIGERACDECGSGQRRRLTPTGTVWTCLVCGNEAGPVAPRHFLPSSYEAACLTCGGVGTVAEAQEERLIVRPDLPLCAGAMYSPGFFPGSYLSKPGNGGYDMLQALATRHGFDPFRTPWRSMSAKARRAFLHGDREPLEVVFRTKVRERVRTVEWTGVFHIIEGWDIGGLYTEHVRCVACDGERLRREYRRVELRGRNQAALHALPLAELERLLAGRLPKPPLPSVAHSLATAQARLRFLGRVGLGYVHLGRTCATLSAGEAQRLKLAALLGGRLTGMSVLLDEPSRGLHPVEVAALVEELVTLRDQGNTILVVEHDGELIGRADEVVVLGPGAGRDGGRIVARGAPSRLARTRHRWALGHSKAGHSEPGRSPERRAFTGELVIRRPRENNLAGEDVTIPLGVLVGLCGVSGSGKSTLAVDTLGLALDPPRLTTSVAYERVEPGAHDAIDGAPARTVVVDQAAQGVTSPAALLGVAAALRRMFAASDAAVAAGLGEQDLTPRCDACNGRGLVVEDMGFLPSVRRPCDACAGTGYTAEAREVRLRGRSLPDLEALTIEEVLRLWEGDEQVARPLRTAEELGLGYLVLRQPGFALSGGELQRLKLAKELMRQKPEPTLFILDEPTVGQSSRDVGLLAGVLHRLVDAGHTALVLEHNPQLLAACDRLVELGPGAGPKGGRVVAAGTPEQVARGRTPIARYLFDALR